jgi:hypothetical protein
LLCETCWKQVEEFIEQNGSMANMKQGYESSVIRRLNEEVTE